jgi:hypothetical protein
LFQHKVMVGSMAPQLIRGAQVQVLESRSIELLEVQISKARAELYEMARPLCAKASETELPPLRAINHAIPLIDESKIYPWHPSRCPEALRPQWV